MGTGTGAWGAGAGAAGVVGAGTEGPCPATEAITGKNNAACQY